MAKTDFKSVDEYLATQPVATRGILQRVRAIIRKALPGAQEVISYQIPAYKVDGCAVIYFAGWTEHFSLYPVNSRVVDAFPRELSRYKMSKGTARFPLAEGVPEKLIERIAKFRAEDCALQLKEKAGGKMAGTKKVVRLVKKGPAKRAGAGKNVAAKKGFGKKLPGKKVAAKKGLGKKKKR
jgi:uncharacterized protein YdhG (YjbR/CyaY superfamily)